MFPDETTHEQKRILHSQQEFVRADDHGDFPTIQENGRFGLSDC